MRGQGLECPWRTQPPDPTTRSPERRGVDNDPQRFANFSNLRSQRAGWWGWLPSEFPTRESPSTGSGSAPSTVTVMEVGGRVSTPLYQTKAEFFKALGHPARIRVLELLSEREHSVSEMLPEVGIEPAHLSQQLAVLRKMNLVVSLRIGLPFGIIQSISTTSSPLSLPLFVLTMRRCLTVPILLWASGFSVSELFQKSTPFTSP